MKTAAIVIIGNEILNGSVKDENSYFLTRQLYRLAIKTQRILVIADDVHEISRELIYCQQKFDYIFTSGGIGPTHDDKTLEGVALAFNTTLMHSPVLRKYVRRYFTGQLTQIHNRLAVVPQGIDLIEDQRLPFPILKFRNVHIFPGVPILLRKQFNFIKKDLEQSQIFQQTILLQGQEVDIAPALEATLSALSGVDIGSYPSFHRDGTISVKLVLHSNLKEKCHQACRMILANLPKHIRILE